MEQVIRNLLLGLITLCCVVVAICGVIVVYNTATKPAVIYINKDISKRHSCGCFEDKCHCCGSCKCQKHRIGDDDEATPPNRVSPLGNTGSTGEKK